MPIESGQPLDPKHEEWLARHLIKTPPSHFARSFTFAPLTRRSRVRWWWRRTVDRLRHGRDV